MWHEARKHEKKLRGLMVDYRRRAERRREFYDRIRSDPASFLQIHGQQLRVHIDPNISQAAETSLMPWMGDKTNMIDRFDVRAHLDHMPVTSELQSNQTSDVSQALERQINYERYRNLVQNDFLGLNETKFLQQIWLEERFGMNQTHKEQQQKVISKKKLAEKKATIAYNYEEEDSTSLTVQQTNKTSDSSESEESSDEDYDFDTTVNIDQLDNESGHRINSIALKYGMKNDDFVRFLDEDKTEAEKIKLAKELESEKSMFTGRKSRRERRALKEQRLLILRASNVEDSDKLVLNKEETDKRNQSSSESEASVDETKIEFITSFGGSSEDETNKEVVEKKQKQVISKRKQKAKAIVCDKSEPSPLVYGPTLPGEDMISSCHTLTSFNKNSHSRKRTYRYNHSSGESHRSRSRSRSNDRRYRRNTNRYQTRRSRSRSRSRSVEMRRSANRTPDRYRRDSRDFRRRRSYSRDRNRRTRSRSRSRRRSDSKNISRRRTRSRSKSRSRRSGRNVGKSYTRNKSRSVSKSRKRSRSNSRRSNSRRSNSRARNSRRSRSRIRDNNSRDKNTSRIRSPVKRSRSKSQNKRESTHIKSEFNVSDKCVTKTSDTKESIPQVVKHEVKVEDIILPTLDPNINIEINTKDTHVLETPLETTETQLNREEKVSSPPIKSYYRHDLCDSSESDEFEVKQTSKVDSNEGSSKKTSSNTSNIPGYKSSATITPQERLKKKMQALIEKQYKRDKRAELEKLEKQHQERVDREEELREMTSRLKYRRRDDSYVRERDKSSRSRSSSSSY